MAVEPTVGFLHPGQMGAVIAGQAASSGTPAAWCTAGRSDATAARAAAAGLQPFPDLAAMLEACDTVFSICPPEFAEDVATQIADRNFRGLYVDANAVSTARIERIATRFEQLGARFVDAAIFGPPFSDDTLARLYLAGAPEDIRAVAELFHGTRVSAIPLVSGTGSASALKMAHSSYQKVTRPLAAIAFALADTHGVGDHLLAEAARVTTSPLVVLDRLPSVAARAWRWGPELEEVADSLRAAGYPAELAHAAASVLGRWNIDRDVQDVPLAAVLSQLRTFAGAGVDVLAAEPLPMR